MKNFLSVLIVLITFGAQLNYSQAATGPAKPKTKATTALRKLIKAVGLDDLKLSSWGVSPEEAEKLAENSFLAMGGLYNLDPIRLDRHDAACIIREAIH